MEFTQEQITESYKKYYLIRINKGFSDSDVSRLARIDRKSFTNWKAGRTLPNIKTLYKVATLCGCQVSDMLSI